MEQSDSAEIVKPASKPLITGFSMGSNPSTKQVTGFSFRGNTPSTSDSRAGLNLTPSDAVYAYNSLQNPTFRCYADLYKKFDDRFQTFKIWPKSHPVKAIEIAAAGFVYTGQGDKVICPWCQIALIEWETTDKPKYEHRRNSPECEFVKMTMPTRQHIP